MIEKLENITDDNKKDAKSSVDTLRKTTNDKFSKQSADYIDRNSRTMSQVMVNKNKINELEQSNMRLIDAISDIRDFANSTKNELEEELERQIKEVTEKVDAY